MEAEPSLGGVVSSGLHSIRRQSDLLKGRRTYIGAGRCDL